MGFPNNTAAITATGGQYLRTDFAGNAEAEKVQDFLNNLHPAVATAHALFRQEMNDSVKPTVLMDDSPINRATTAASSLTTEAKAAGDAATFVARGAPTRMFNRMQTYHEGVAASRESQRIRLYGIEDSMDRGIDRSLISTMDHFERAFHFGQGTENTGGAPPKPRTHGLMSWAAWTGLEKRHGVASPAQVSDNMQDIPAKYWTSFYNAQGTILDRAMLYDQIFSVPWQIGHQVDGSFVLCGDKPMRLFAEMPHMPGRGSLNEREISARDQALIDIITMIETPAYGTFYLVPDRLMAIPSVQLDYTNTGLAVGTVGTIAAAIGQFNLDTSLLSIMASEFSIQVIDHIHYKQLATDGDYSAGMIGGEKLLQCEHLFGIAGAARVTAA
jgi:hypothetical protein